jgi:hypothetical protein
VQQDSGGGEESACAAGCGVQGTKCSVQVYNMQCAGVQHAVYKQHGGEDRRGERRLGVAKAGRPCQAVQTCTQLEHYCTALKWRLSCCCVTWKHIMLLTFLLQKTQALHRSVPLHRLQHSAGVLP